MLDVLDGVWWIDINLFLQQALSLPLSKLRFDISNSRR